jgi:site-specific DNA recombinase
MKHLQVSGMNVTGKANCKNGILTYNKSKGARVKRDITQWIAAVSSHEGIIDASAWLKVQRILDINKTKAPRLGTSSSALLTVTLKCSKCGKSMIVKHGHISALTNNKIQYYVCSTKDYSKGTRCNNPNIRVDELENEVIDSLKNIHLSKDVLIDELRKIRSEKSKNNLILSEIESLPAEINIKQSQIDVLVNQLSLDNDISKYLKSQILKLGYELEKLNIQYESIKTISCKKNNSNVITFVESIENFSTIINTLNFDNKRLLINTVVKSIFWDGTKGIVSINIISLK